MDEYRPKDLIDWKIDICLATQLFKLMDKYRPEDKQAKKQRLKERAEAKAAGKVSFYFY